MVNLPPCLRSLLVHIRVHDRDPEGLLHDEQGFSEGGKLMRGKSAHSNYKHPVGVRPTLYRIFVSSESWIGMKRFELNPAGAHRADRAQRARVASIRGMLAATPVIHHAASMEESWKMCRPSCEPGALSCIFSGRRDRGPVGSLVKTREAIRRSPVTAPEQVE